MTELTLVKTLFLKAPPSHIWRFLTEADKLAVWFHAGDHDIEDVGPYSLVTNSLGREGERLCWGEVTEVDPHNRLVHTFTHNHLGGVETTCIWTLEAVEGGTILTLRHEGFEKAKDAFVIGADHDIGWDEHFQRLRKVVS